MTAIPLISLPLSKRMYLTPYFIYKGLLVLTIDKYSIDVGLPLLIIYNINILLFFCIFIFTFIIISISIIKYHTQEYCENRDILFNIFSFICFLNILVINNLSTYNSTHVLTFYFIQRNYQSLCSRKIHKQICRICYKINL